MWSPQLSTYLYVPTLTSTPSPRSPYPSSLPPPHGITSPLRLPLFSAVHTFYSQLQRASPGILCLSQQRRVRLCQTGKSTCRSQATRALCTSTRFDSGLSLAGRQNNRHRHGQARVRTRAYKSRLRTTPLVRHPRRRLNDNHACNN